MGTGKPEVCRQVGRLEILVSSRLGEFLPPQGSSVFSLKAFNWSDEAHRITRVLGFTPSQLIQTLLTPDKYLHSNI